MPYNPQTGEYEYDFLSNHQIELPAEEKRKIHRARIVEQILNSCRAISTSALKADYMGQSAFYLVHRAYITDLQALIKDLDSLKEIK